MLAYEEALELELYLEEVMTKLPEKDRVPRTPVPLGGSVAPTTPIGQILRTPKTPLKTPKDPPVLGSGVKEEEVGDVSAILEVIDVEEGDASVQKAKRVKDLLYEQIYPRWKESIEAKSREESWDRKPGLERFEPGVCHIVCVGSRHFLISNVVSRAYLYANALSCVALLCYAEGIPGGVRHIAGTVGTEFLPPGLACKMV